MTQCKKKNTDGTQCGNRAVPGSEFCNEHRERIQFHKQSASPPADKPDPPTPFQEALPEAPSSETGAATVVVTGRSDAPRLPGLRRDEMRGVLIGPQAIVRLTEPNRLTELLSGLSCVTPLDHVEVQRHATHGVLIRVRPLDPQAEDLSAFYDRLAESVRLCDAEMYVGDEQAFIRYRDFDAPYGYDLSRKPGKKFKRLTLFGPEPPLKLGPKELKPVSVRDLVLASVPVISHRGPESLRQIFVLCSTSLEKTFRRYFRSHHLTYRVTRLSLGSGQANPDHRTLFEVEPLAAETTLPSFAIAYLRSFPRCAVLSEAFQGDHRRVLVELGCTTVWDWAQTATVLPEDGWLLLMRNEEFPNLCLEPSPHLIDGDTLLEVAAKGVATLKPLPLETASPAPCRFEIRFQRDNGPPTAPVAALLSEDELRWLRRLLYRLPASEFSQYLVLVARPWNLLIAESVPLRDLPLGIPMKRVADSSLLIPCQLKLVPDLPTHLLAEALHVTPGKLTFLTETFRCEAARSDFAPLSSLLYSPHDREPIELVLEPMTELPNFRWELPAGLDEPAEPVAPPATRRRTNSAAPRPQPEGATEVAELILAMKSRAANLRATDPLGAALYSALAGDPSVSADLFRNQASRLRGEQQRPRSSP